MATTHDIASNEAMEPKGPSPRIRTVPSVFSEVPGLPCGSGLGRGLGYLGLLDKCHGNHMVPSRANRALQATWNWTKQSLKRAARSTSIFVNEGSALEVLQEAGAQ